MTCINIIVVDLTHLCICFSFITISVTAFTFVNKICIHKLCFNWEDSITLQLYKYIHEWCDYSCTVNITKMLINSRMEPFQLSINVSIIQFKIDIVQWLTLILHCIYLNTLHEFNITNFWFIDIFQQNIFTLFMTCTLHTLV